jgi:hypothetical protein
VNTEEEEEEEEEEEGGGGGGEGGGGGGGGGEEEEEEDIHAHKMRASGTSFQSIIIGSGEGKTQTQERLGD